MTGEVYSCRAKRLERRSELARAGFPAETAAMSGAGRAVAGERPRNRLVKVGIHRPDLIVDHVARAGYGEGRDRRPSGERLDHHQAERVGAAWENEHVR